MIITTFVPPVTKDQRKSVGKAPDCLYWSATFTAGAYQVIGLDLARPRSDCF